jgi:biopolymer transport protein TolR
MAGLNTHPDEDITGINVTPLVDIMLVLLIIFMVTANQIIQPAIEVDLPRAAAGGAAVDPTLSVALSADGGLFLNGEPATEAEIGARCAALSRESPGAQAIIAADRRVSHGRVVELIDVVRTHGITKFALNIEPTGEKG